MQILLQAYHGALALQMAKRVMVDNFALCVADTRKCQNSTCTSLWIARRFRELIWMPCDVRLLCHGLCYTVFSH